MCRDAEMAARDYVRLVLTGVGSVTDISVAQTLLRQAGVTLRRYADPAWRPAGLQASASALRDLLAGAGPGTDAQLAYAQAFSRIAVSAGDLALLGGLLDGSEVIDGLAVDTELRWMMLHRLVSRGAAGLPEIESELARDPTDAGERHAATCRAAVPQPAAKQRAWEDITSGSMPNAMFRAALAGFADPDRLDLLVPYHRKFFEVVPRIWRDWSNDMAQWFVTNAYPMADSADVIAATDDFIARENPPAPLRRLLLEGRDGIERALRCQRRDRGA
jgi:aminopeptidase N